jgi:hypothetical protein
MEPQLPKPQFNPEAAPSVQPAVRSGEVFVAPKVPERAAPLEQGRETREVMTDGPKGDPSVAQPFTPPPLPSVGPTQATGTTPVTDDVNPVAASDDDLIEKEWVEKAKQVVAETRNDPHAQDLAVSKLQADYLKKRYGKVIAVPKEE